MRDDATNFKTQISEGPSWWVPELHIITRIDEGYVDPNDLLHLPGLAGEHLQFDHDPTGGYGEQQWNTLIEDVRVNGLQEAILIFKEMDGRAGIHEGNHRLRAAVAAALTRVPVEIRYFGNSQRAGLVIDPRTGKPPGIVNAKEKEPMGRMQNTPPKYEAYRLIEEWCAKNPGTGSTLGLMRLVLSLYNGRAFSFSIPVCIWNLDGARLEWAKAIILDYFERGETDELLELASKFAPKIEPFEWSPESS